MKIFDLEERNAEKKVFEGGYRTFFLTILSLLTLLDFLKLSQILQGMVDRIRHGLQRYPALIPGSCDYDEILLQ